jgi:hypothetical protein
MVVEVVADLLEPGIPIRVEIESVASRLAAAVRPLLDDEHVATGLRLDRQSGGSGRRRRCSRSSRTPIALDALLGL